MRTCSNGMDVNETKFRLSSVLWITLFLCGLLLYFVDVFQIEIYTLHPTRAPMKDLNFEERALRGFTINTPGCRIPEMDPFSDNVKKFMEPPVAPRCNKGIPALFEANLTSIYLVNSSLAQYNVTDPGELKCCYQVFRRESPKDGETDDKIVYSPECYFFNESVNINEEFIKVVCMYEEGTIYVDLFAFVPIKNNLKLAVTNPLKFNVLMIGMDAVSRLNLHRQMPKTVKYLTKIEAVELLGYNKVGDNTFPNLIPVLTGMSETQLKNTCWPHTNEYFDKCPFVWKEYKGRGYVTSYGEDASWMGLFNYQRKGFRNQSTDYGYNYFNRHAESVIGNSHNVNVYECIGSKMVYKELLDYINKFVVVMTKNSLPFFAFFWGASLSHDYLNQPKLGDEVYYDFFKNLHDEGYLDNTVMIFMSDHGIRWGAIRQTFQGRMEERLPFVFVALPKRYKLAHPNAYYNLKKNARRLTTPFDLHETLVDLLNITSGKSQGVSLFNEISKMRTCESIGISTHWCTCQQSVEVERNSTDVIQAAMTAVNYINSELKGYAQCANLTLDEVLNARLMTHDNNIKNNDSNNIQDYMVTFRTIPGEGVFEATVRHFQRWYKSEVMGTISRLNLYGKQSACITDFHLKLYCYCNSLL